MWLYAPVSVRIIPHRNSSDVYSLSGIYLVNPETAPVNHLFLTICHVPKEDLEQKYTFRVAAPQFSSENDVFWYEATPLAFSPVFSDTSDPLYDHISICMRKGFSFIPSETLPGNSLLQSLNLVSLSCRPFYSKETRHLFDVFITTKATALSRITVRSSPFNLTNSKLFSDFKSVGHINMAISKDQKCSGYLTDVKYLESMIGGVVSNDEPASIGLLAGNLRKLNGDGDLTVVISWDMIMANLTVSSGPLKFHSNSQRRLVASNISSGEPLYGHESKTTSLCKASPASDSSYSLSDVPVLPVVLSRNGGKFSWGTCVLLNPHTLVTNNHVLKLCIDSKDVDCHVYLEKNLYIQLSDKDEIITPFEGLDLAFIELCVDNQFQLSRLSPARLCFSQNVTCNDPIYSAGFGLFLNEKLMTPLFSSGYVSSRLILDGVFQKNEQSEEVIRKTPCMLITSSNCWNGSSGGGIFTKTGCFFGLICSNAEVCVPSLSGELSQRTEKIPSFCFCIPLELILECYRVKVMERKENVSLDDRLTKAWSLQTFHEDLIEREAKL